MSYFNFFYGEMDFQIIWTPLIWTFFITMVWYAGFWENSITFMEKYTQPKRVFKIWEEESFMVILKE